MIHLTLRIWRYIWLTPVLGGVGLIVLWILGFVSFVATVIALSFANPVNKPITKTDGTVVLTGGAERVRTGLELLQQNKTRELLISGVHRAADLRDLLLRAHMSEQDFPCCITLGFEADDTLGNARETAHWAKDHRIKTLRVVTASYHMPRALVEMKYALPNTGIIPYPVVPKNFNLWSPLGIDLTIKEYHKTILALARISLTETRALLHLK